MRIGVDATCWQNRRGYGRHIRALLGALVRTDRSNHYTLFMDSDEDTCSVPEGVEFHVVRTSAATAVAASATGHRSIRDIMRMSRALARGNFDVVLFPTIYSYVPVFSRARKVVIIHDVIAEKFSDLTHPGKLARLFWRAKVALGRWDADALVTVSEHSRKGLVEHFGVDPHRVAVVGEACDQVFRVLEQPAHASRLEALGLSLDNRMVVYVGGFNPHKNLETLVSAFARLVCRTDFCDVRLVLVGDYEREVFHSYYDTIRHQVETLGLSRHTVFTGYLPDEELVALLNRATVLALPSLLEGFGLPAIEAAACGCPVIATTASPLPSLLGDGGLFVDPRDLDGWESALAKVLGSEAVRQEMRTAGLAAARRLTWEAAAGQLMDVFKKVQPEPADASLRV